MTIPIVPVEGAETPQWSWECPCGAYATGAPLSTVQYSVDQHELTHTQEWAEPAPEPPAEPEPDVAE